MAQEAKMMVADSELTRRINAAQNPAELASILEDAMSRGNIATRDPETGRFIPAAQTVQQTQQPAAVAMSAEKQPTIITKTQVIGGQELTFEGTDIEVERQIAAAWKAANAVKQQLTERKSAEHVALEKAEWERKLRTGQCTAAEYLENTGAIDTYLRDRGVDIQQIADERYTQSWADATAAFLQEASNDWPGGEKNKEILGLTLMKLGLENAEDKLGAIKQAYAEMKRTGLVLSTEPSQRDLEEAIKNMSPQEIMSAWKQSAGIEDDPEAANEAFIEAFKTGRSSGVFGA